MQQIADLVRAGLIPFMVVVGATLAALVCHVMALHGVREIMFRRRQRLIALYRPLVEQALRDDAGSRAFDRLQAAPGRHRAVITTLLLEPLRVAHGALTDRARAAAGALGLVFEWRADLCDRRWWVRAEAAHALGLVQAGGAVEALVTALDDPLDEVRAASVEALGLIGDSASIPDLVTRLGEQSRHQRVRLVRALQQFGSAAVGPVLAHAAAHPQDLVFIAELLGSIRAVGALETLVGWCGHARPDVRVAALEALGAIGVDDRSYYHVLRALDDEVDEVRAMAAWALGRSGREDAASYLGAKLTDQWIVAAQSARALRQLGAAGRRELEAAAAGDRAEMAQQMLWECSAAARA